MSPDNTSWVSGVSHMMKQQQDNKTRVINAELIEEQCNY